jgi:predicted amidophosphoribosyltransferase
MREPLLPEEEPIFPCICGAVFMENERFCSRCGRSEEEAIAAFAEKERRAGEKMICPDCSSHISRGLVFCPFCGAALDRPGW